MKFTLLALSGSLLPLLTSATPVAKDQDDTPSKFSVVADNKDAPEIDGKSMEARGYGFWLGGEPATYCPENVGDVCPPGNETAIRSLKALVRKRNLLSPFSLSEKDIKLNNCS